MNQIPLTDKQRDDLGLSRNPKPNFKRVNRKEMEAEAERTATILAWGIAAIMIAALLGASAIILYIQ